MKCIPHFASGYVSQQPLENALIRLINKKNRNFLISFLCTGFRAGTHVRKLALIPKNDLECQCILGPILGSYL